MAKQPMRWVRYGCKEKQIERSVCKNQENYERATTSNQKQSKIKSNKAIKSKDGKLLTEPEQIKGRWQEYCSELYQHITTADQQALNITTLIAKDYSSNDISYKIYSKN